MAQTFLSSSIKISHNSLELRTPDGIRSKLEYKKTLRAIHPREKFLPRPPSW